MFIDQCTHTFEELSSKVLPTHFARLQEVIKNPFSATSFTGVASALKLVGRTRDFSGCYVFLEDGRPFYVGISRKVVSRLNQHLKYRTHFSASLAYKITASDHPHGLSRSNAMKDEAFKEKFLVSQKRLGDMSIAFVEIDNPVELHVFEVYAAMKLGTKEWNTFRTH